jgi:putative glutamine amidotransferase
MSKPLIGLTAYREEASWGVWQTKADVLPAVYADAVEQAGGVPVLLPASSPTAAAARSVLARLDGLVISGGADVSPARYGEEPHERTASWREDRDAWELALLEAAAAQDTPTLGVCRGMQVMAVAAGGKLDQHVPDLVGHEQHSPGGDRFGSTTVRIEDGTLLASLVGDHLEVHCHHHQAVRSHPGFRAVAWATDGTVEAMESADARFRVAVQWHPEMAVDAGIFSGLVRAAVDRT